MKIVAQFFSKLTAATAIEYALITGLISIGVVATIVTLSSRLV